MQCSRVTITTMDGKSFTHQVDVPKGDYRDPMTLDELQVKFDALAAPVMSESRRAALKKAVFDLENMADGGSLMSLTIADK